MNAKDAIKTSLGGNHYVLTHYLSDLSDADLLVRPAAGANHIAWQLGHLINAEGVSFMKYIPGATQVELPAGFAEKHSKQTIGSDSPKDFHTKEEYLGLFKKVRANTLETLAKLPEADLDKPVEGDIARVAPTVGALFILIANHEMMHGGQFAVVRRKLGKPVLI